MNKDELIERYQGFIAILRKRIQIDLDYVKQLENAIRNLKEEE